MTDAVPIIVLAVLIGMAAVAAEFMKKSGQRLSFALLKRTAAIQLVGAVAVTAFSFFSDPNRQWRFAAIAFGFYVISSVLSVCITWIVLWLNENPPSWRSSSEREAPSNTVHNEQLKLLAGWLDRASTACLTVGVLTPTVAYLFNLGDARTKLNLHEMLLLVVVFLAVSMVLHSVARGLLRGLRS